MGLRSRLSSWLEGDTSKRDAAFDALGEVVRSRQGMLSNSPVPVNQETALWHSAVWAGLRLRANMESSLPIDAYRKVGGVQVEAPLSPFFETPCGPDSFIDEWLWATRFDLDRYGVTVGVITERDGLNLPRTIELLPAGSVQIRGSGWRIEEITYRRMTYGGVAESGVLKGGDLADIYIEHQYRPAGFPVGLCPIAQAAWTIGGYLSAQKFALDYFGNGAFPSGVLKNVTHEVPPANSRRVRESFMAATADRAPAVVGKDWEWQPADAPKAAEAFLESQRASVVDVARYLDVPADMIDGAIAGSSLTYANISQRMVQMLVTSMGPALQRRERRLSRLIPRPRFIKLNSDALLRMDPETRAKVLNEAIKGFRMAPSEARALDNREPYTESQYAEFERLGLTKQKADPATDGDPTGVPA